MEKETRKYGWELVAKDIDDLNKFFKIDNGKITAWHCLECDEWVSDSFKSSCGTTLTVGQFQQD